MNTKERKEGRWDGREEARGKGGEKGAKKVGSREEGKAKET